MKEEDYYFDSRHYKEDIYEIFFGVFFKGPARRMPRE
jgi:hypothetical protein